MPTQQPTSAPTVPPTTKPSDENASSDKVGLISIDYDAGFEDGMIAGRWQGRKDVWNALLICLGNSLGTRCEFWKAAPYLQAMECFLDIEKLSMKKLKAKINKAKANIARCKMEPKIRKLIRDHWKGKRR